jgi:hypothetical protein
VLEQEWTEKLGIQELWPGIATPSTVRAPRAGQGAYEDQMVKEGGRWHIAHRRVRTDRLVADPHKPVNLAGPDVAALVGHLLEAAQRLGQKVE